MPRSPLAEDALVPPECQAAAPWAARGAMEHDVVIRLARTALPRARFRLARHLKLDDWWYQAEILV